MSFILDALRKSDQQRQHSATPTLMTAPQATVETSKPAALWWYGLLAAVLVGAGVLIGWLHRGQSEPTVATVPNVPPSAARPPEASAQKFTAAPLPALPETVRKAESQPPAREATAVVATAERPATIETKPEKPAKPVSASPAASSQAPAPKQEEHASAVPDAGVIAAAELPPAIQQELPKLAILAHSYSSKPKARFVYINDRMVHEEESPAPGLKLEQITPDGMIFSYKGYRFRRGANQ
ncbi:MAG: general secretion pathway protein GspB [Sterolibacterium sp.]